jgi:hypothetical protein
MVKGKISEEQMRKQNECGGKNDQGHGKDAAGRSGGRGCQEDQKQKQ